MNNTYTEEMFQEDRKIAFYVFRTKFAGWSWLKDDLIQCAMIRLKNIRLNYTINEDKGSYKSVAFKSAWREMFSYLQKEKRKDNNFKNLSKDEIISGTNDLLFEDSQNFSVENNFNENFDYQTLLNTCNEVIAESKSNTFKEVATLCMQGLGFAEIGNKLGFSRQAAECYVKKFRNKLAEKLNQQKQKEKEKQELEEMINKIDKTGIKEIARYMLYGYPIEDIAEITKINIKVVESVVKGYVNILKDFKKQKEQNK